MKYYKRIVYAGLGLCFVAFFGTLNDFLFSPIVLPDGLPATLLPPEGFSLCFLFFYLCFALLFATFLATDELKKKIWAPLSVLLLSTAWCVLYFVFSLDDVGCGVLVVSFVILCYAVATAIKESSFAVLYGLPVLIFFAFLVANAILLAIFSE